MFLNLFALQHSSINNSLTKDGESFASEDVLPLIGQLKVFINNLDLPQAQLAANFSNGKFAPICRYLSFTCKLCSAHL